MNQARFLRLTTEKVHSRIRIETEEGTGFLAWGSFRVLFLLALAQASDRESIVRKPELALEEQSSKVIYRLKSNLRQEGLGKLAHKIKLSMNKLGYYLNLEPSAISFDEVIAEEIQDAGMESALQAARQ